MGLVLPIAADRRAWAYFASQNIRAAYRAPGGTWTALDGPYEVLDETGNIAPFDHRRAVPEGAEWGIDADDVEFVLRYLPYLFDSLGTTALKVGQRHILWWHERKLSPVQAKREAKRNAEGREAWDRVRRLPADDPRHAEAWRILMRRRKPSKYRALSPLNHYAHGEAISFDAGGAKRALDTLLAHGEFFNVMGWPWVFRDARNRVEFRVAPPFKLRRPSWVPAEFRARRWLDEAGQDWKELLNLAETKGEAMLDVELTERWMRQIHTDPHYIAYSPNLIGRVKEMGFDDLWLLGLPEALWPSMGFHDVAAKRAQLEKASELAEIRPYWRAFMESIRSRRLAFGRFYEMDDLSRKHLPGHFCENCGDPVHKTHARGRYPKFCVKPACQAFAVDYRSSSQRRASREFRRRTRET